MSSDLHGRITTDYSGASKGLTETAKGVKKVEDATKAANRAGSDFHRVMNKGLTDVGKNAKQTGEALAKIGGPGGGLIGQVLGGTGLSGGMATVAALAGTAAVGMKLFGAVATKMGQDAEGAAVHTLELAAAMRKARETSDQLANAALRHAEARRRLLAVGGEEAVAAAEAMAAGGVASPEDAAAGVTAIYGRYGRGARARAAVNTAAAAARVGVPFAAAATEVAANGADMTDGQVARSVATNIFGKHFGMRTNRRQAYDQALIDIHKDPLLARQEEGRKIAGEQREAEEAKAIERGTAKGRETLAATIA
ncbi:MAG TPA: hypothetical protein VD931_02900, partial [Baekduia sp.]|nr:hypothetical protein [Baekduia sp.]